MAHPTGAIGLGVRTSTTSNTYFWFATTSGDNIVSVSGATQACGGCDITWGVSKSPIIIPIPNDDNFGFDVGFTDSETVSINVTNLSSATSGSFAMTLRNVLRKQTGVDSTLKNKPMPFIWSDNTFYVLPRNLTIKQESGAGDIVALTVQLEVVKNA
jgi:hypothetical protein